MVACLQIEPILVIPEFLARICLVGEVASVCAMARSSRSSTRREWRKSNLSLGWMHIHIDLLSRHANAEPPDVCLH